MREPHEVLEGLAALYADEAQEAAGQEMQARMRDDKTMAARLSGEERAYRRVSRSLAGAADGLRPSEEFPFDMTPADLDLPFEGVAT